MTYYLKFFIGSDLSCVGFFIWGEKKALIESPFNLFTLLTFVMNVTDITFLFPQSSLCEVSDRTENQVL